ncbi:MAG TPA: nitroreductase family protein [Acidimicrobiales bacterium]|nr:nitroreductase family protein [Acidimicrobiales bacterium]
MELQDALGRRSMCRDFADDPVDATVLDRILAGALSAPTAGNTQGTSWVVLEGAAQTATYWDATTDEDWRARNPEWFSGLERAPVVLLAYASPSAYVARYAEPDKADELLGTGPEAWPIPYWFGDAAFGVMAVLLQAVDAGLGACVLGNFRAEKVLAGTLGVPGPWRLFCAVVLGRPAGKVRRSRSLERLELPFADRVHRGGW